MQTSNSKPRILCMDIETAPSKAYIWGLWNEVRDTAMVEEDWYIMCWAAKWLGEKKIIHSSLPDFKSYSKEPDNDKHILKLLWKLLDKADIVVAHNGIRFDRRKVNARFIMHGITPPSPYRMIDTLRVAKSEFNFTSNKLNNVAKYLNVGKKAETGGFKLWKDCMSGDLKAWKKMQKYCDQDVRLLEEVYLKMRPYILNHPNCGVYEEDETPICPKCSSSDIYYRGYYHTNLSSYKRFRCNKCGGWGRERINILSLTKRKSLTTNAM